MRRIIALAALTSIAGAVAAATVTAVATAAPTACGPQQVGGATVRTWCGPAKVTITMPGRKLMLKGGQCELEDYGGLTLFTINVGRYTVPPAKPKATSFSAAGDEVKPGKYKGWGLINFQTPGKQWLYRTLTVKVTVLKAGARKATFTGQLENGATASGTWTC